MTLQGQRLYRRSERTQAQQRGFHRAFTTLSLAIERAHDDGKVVPCVTQPHLYYEPDQKLSTASGRAELKERRRDCERLCRTCPVLEVCCTYADVARSQRLAGGNYLPHRELVAA